MKTGVKEEGNGGGQVGRGGLQNKNTVICHLPKNFFLSFKALVSSRKNFYWYMSKRCSLNELKAEQDE